jgi:chondroitin-sulfate-ABC endolyase/exolyase
MMNLTRTHCRLIVLALCLLPALRGVAQIVDNPRMFSFESDDDLKYITATDGSVALSNTHFKNGKKSMEWDFKPGGSFAIKKDLQFEPHEKGNRDNYLSAFIVWVYSEKPMPGKQARFQFLKGGKVCTSFPMNLDFKGWRGAWVCYERDMEGKPEVGMDEIRVLAPDLAGTLWIDHLITAVKVDPRQQTADLQVPFVNKATKDHWLSIMKNYATKPDLQLTDLTDKNRQEMRQMEDKFRSLVYVPAKLYPKQMEEMRADFKKYNIKEKKGIVTGEGIWFSRAAEAYERMIPNWDKDILVRAGVEMNDYFKLMERIARGYNNAATVEEMNELKDMFLLMYDHITDQGVTYGSCWGNIHHYGYSIRSMYIAYFLMKDVLKQAGKLDEAVKTMIWYSQLNELYAKPVGPGIDTDTFNTASIGCFAAILLMDDSPEKWRYLRSCSRWLDWGCRPAPGLADAFKVDGSGYHHCNNYPAYAVGGLNGASQMIYVLSGSELAVSELAHQTVKNVLLAMRFYCNLTYFPLALSGRHPNGTGHLTPIHYAYMAMAGTPDGKQDFDADMAAAFMRLIVKPKTTMEKKIYTDFQQRGVTPELDPQGNLALGYACTSVQRRSNWAAVVRGQSRYLWGAEHYVNENRYGRYLGYGSLQLLTAPKGVTVTPKSSGWSQEGFDWNRIPGVTSIHLSLDDLEAKIRNVDISSGVEEMLITDQAFAGGLSQMGLNGNFGMKLHEHDKYHGSFHARKSYHFFDNVIVCLGSDIEDKVTDHNTETTIFQIAALDDAAKNYWTNYHPGQKTWMDQLGTGYYTPDKATFTGLVTQQSRTESLGEPTQGQWATLYIDHGKAPKGAHYEYAMLPQTTPEALKAFETTPSYTVIQQDSNAHIVRSTATNTLSYVIFETPKGILPGGPLLKTDTTCLAMVRNLGAHKMMLTVAQPDLALYRGPSDDIYVNGKAAERSIYGRKWRNNPGLEIPVTVTLLGKWNFTPTENIKLVAQDNKTTTIQFVCKDGMSYNLELNK